MQVFLNIKNDFRKNLPRGKEIPVYRAWDPAWINARYTLRFSPREEAR